MKTETTSPTLKQVLTVQSRCSYSVYLLARTGDL